MKSRLPKGYGGGPSNMNDMIKQAQKMQELMAQKQEELAERTFEASSGGGAVSVTVNGSKMLTDIVIKPEVVDPEDVEMLSDLIIAAVNEALRTADEETNKEMESITGGVQLPGM
ncbi:MAG: YbaB/EbfC family nucleoid-associated protein [Oscillospiraceae bacterium]|nr:YbaB/EbfC family nucleoid-associated protein [Oscillospiraceae bacterium]